MYVIFIINVFQSAESVIMLLNYYNPYLNHLPVTVQGPHKGHDGEAWRLCETLEIVTASSLHQNSKERTVPSSLH